MGDIGREDQSPQEEIERRKIYTPELEEYYKTMRKITETRSKIFRSKADEQTKLNLLNGIKAKITSQVYAEKEDGKNKFTNQQQRDAEIDRRLRNHDHYLVFRAEYDTMIYEKEMNVMKLEDLKQELRYWKLVIETLNAEVLSKNV